MAIPAGITTALVHLDAPISFAGDVGRIHATVAPSIPLVWAATGTPIGNFIDNVSLDPGIPLELELPHVDQAGFLDGNGNAVTGWYYSIEITYERGGQTIPFPTRDFQILSGQAEVDLALIPGGGAAPAPMVAPILPVTSIGGFTGEITPTELDLIISSVASVTGKVSKGSLFINAKDHGVVGDGVADDTAAIQALFNALAPYTVLFFPAGKYKHTNLTINGKSNFTLLGEQAEFIATTRTQRYIGLTNCSKFTLRGIISHGAVFPLRQNPTRAISLENCHTFHIDGNTAGNNEGVGIYLGATSKTAATGCYNGRISNNFVHDTRADGIHITGGSRRINVVGNNCRDTGDDSIAVVSYSTDFDGCEAVVITGNQNWHSGSRGIAVVGGRDVSVSGNVIDSPKNAGVYAGTEITEAYTIRPVVNLSITGNTIRDANVYVPPLDTAGVGNMAGIHITAPDVNNTVRSLTVTGNTITGSKWHGILVANSGAAALFDAVIANNTILDSGSLGLLVQQATNVSVSGNLIRNTNDDGLALVNTLGMVSVIGNQVIDACLTSVQVARRGILITSANISRGMVASNIVVDTGAKLTDRLDVSASTNILQFGNAIGGNHSGSASAFSQPFSVPGSLLLAGAQATSGMGGGAGVVGLRNAGTVPTTNPASGGILYGQDGAGMWRTSNGTIQAFAGNTSFVSANYTALVSDRVILASGGAAGITVTLPAGVKGQRHTIKKIDSAVGVVTVATTSAQTIDGGLTRLLSGRYDTLTLESDGNVWYILGRVGDVLTSANGTRFRLGVEDDGALTTTSL